MYFLETLIVLEALKEALDKREVIVVDLWEENEEREVG
jgi:hypothetical protein